MYNIINTKQSPQPIGPYVQGVQINNFVFISGQIPININSEIISNDISKQTEKSLQNIKNIIEKVGLKVNNIVKTTIFLINLKEIDKVNCVYKNFFIQNNARYPARTCVEVSKLPKNAKIEIEAIAIKNNL
ncbi:Rid family detoxifying hydrolase [Buchnera aphidicola]|uniref:Rid family detoxifying hydrolase n=1 Tax=Buchnera aphidicola TaxID=9 RepID=UPI003463AEEC